MGKQVTHPTKPEDLSREGLLWLVQQCAVVTDRDLHFARYRELMAISNAASEAWRASLPQAEQAWKRHNELLALAGTGLRGVMAVRTARNTAEAAEAKQERLWRALQRANATANAYWLTMDAARAAV